MSYLGALGPAHPESELIQVLVVDDQPDLADVAAEFLEQKNDWIKADTEASATDAFDRLATESFDCIVSDYEMPGMDGLEFLEQLREEHPDLPFVLFTGKGSEEIASEAISAGVTDYLQKESGTDQYTVLANRVENAVQQYRSQRAVEATERKLTQLAERTDDILFMFDGDWSELLFINSAYEDIWGGTIAELLDDPQSFKNYIHPDDRSKADEAVARLLNGESNIVEYRVRTDDGDYRWVRGKSKPIFDADGNVSRITGFVRDITEQRERERDLERYKILTQEASDIVSVVGADGIIQSVNPAIERILGYEQSNLEGEVVFEYIHPEDQQLVRERFANLVSDEGPQTDRIQYRIRHVDGSYRWLESEASSRTDTTLGGYVITSRDITERIERDKELEQYGALIDSMGDPAMIIDSDRRLEFANEAALACSEESLQELQGTPIEELTIVMAAGGDEAGRIESTLDTVFEEDALTGASETVELRLGSSMGAVYSEFQVSAVTIDGDTKAIITGRDITDRKRREEALNRLHEETEVFMEATDRKAVANHAVKTTSLVLDQPVSGVWLYDESDELLRPAAVTDQGQDVVGNVPTFEEGEGLSWHIFETGEVGVYNDLRNEADRYNQETNIQREMLLPLGDHGLMAVGRADEYEFDEMDEALARILANTVEAALDRANREAKLRSQHRELQRQNERLEDFASIVSHDLRNPLSVAQGRVELAKADCDSDHFDAISRALNRMEALIDDILTLAREGSSVTDITPVSLAEMVTRCWQTVKTADATLTTRTDATIQADQARVQQLLENLFRNAVEHGGDTVTVTVGDLDTGFYIEDDGEGIPDDKLENVFDIGFSTERDGTGFGLSIVEQVAEVHDWEITICESANGGARFEFRNVDFDPEN